MTNICRLGYTNHVELWTVAQCLCCIKDSYPPAQLTVSLSHINLRGSYLLYETIGSEIVMPKKRNLIHRKIWDLGCLLVSLSSYITKISGTREMGSLYLCQLCVLSVFAHGQTRFALPRPEINTTLSDWEAAGVLPVNRVSHLVLSTLKTTLLFSEVHINQLCPPYPAIDGR